MVDKISIKEHHTVLRLPPYYRVLNSIELVALKKGIRKSNSAPNLNAAVVDLIQTEVNKINRGLCER